MAVQEAQVVVQFRGGVETKEDRKGVLPTKLLALENAVFTKVLSTVKRFGYEDLGNDVMGADDPLPTGIALGRRGGELLSFSVDQVHSFIDDSDRWVHAGDLRSIITSTSPVAKTGTNQTLAVHCLNDGISLYGWEDSAGGVWYSLTDDVTGRTLVVPTQVYATASRPRCVAMGSFLFLVFAMESERELRILRFSHDEPTAAPVEDTLRTDLSPTLPCYDISLHGDDSMLVWIRDSGDIGIGFLARTGSIGGGGLATVSSIAAAPSSALACCTNDNDLTIVAWSEVASPFAVKYVTMDSSSGAFVARHAVRTVATPAAAPAQITCTFDDNIEDEEDTAWIFWQTPAAAAQNHTVDAARTDVDASVFTVYDSWTQRGMGLASKAFRHGNEAFVTLGRDSTLYRTYYTMRARGRLVVTRLLPGLGNGHLPKAHLPSVRFDAASSRWIFPVIYVTDVETPGHNIFSESGIRQVELLFESTEAFRTVESGATTYIAGGFLSAYDGSRIVEAEFHYGIDDVGAPTLGAPTIVGLDDGTYNYVFALENTLANGEIQRGPVSAPVTVVVTGGPRRVTFAVPTLRLTAMPNARIAAYRTLSDDASIYSRLTDFNPETAGEVDGFLANDTSVDTITFIDEMPDAVLEEQDPLYTNGGIPGNDPLGGAMLVASGAGRVFMVDAADPLSVYFSQQREIGFALETTPLLRFDVDAYGGDIRALAILDGAIVIFKETAIHRVTGSGPLANPDVGGGWSEPELVTSEVGCLSPESVVQTPQGVMFQSEKGIYLLGRDWQVSYVGAPAEAYNGQTVRAATLIEDRTQVRFVTDAGKALLFDYERNQWSTFTNHEGADAIVVAGTYHYLRTNGRTWRETTEYRDGNARIRAAIETAWINTAGHLQGLNRLWWATVIGEYKSPHTLKVYIAFDYQDGWYGDPILIDPSEGRDEAVYGAGIYGDGPYGGQADTRYQFQIHIGQECEAIRFRFEDAEAHGDFGASFELSELHLTGAVERSNYTVENARAY